MSQEADFVALRYKIAKDFTRRKLEQNRQEEQLKKARRQAIPRQILLLAIISLFAFYSFYLFYLVWGIILLRANTRYLILVARVLEIYIIEFYYHSFFIGFAVNHHIILELHISLVLFCSLMMFVCSIAVKIVRGDAYP